MRDPDMELSIRLAKQAASERQPIRHDVYLSHIAYYEALLNGNPKVTINRQDGPKINYSILPEYWFKHKNRENKDGRGVIK